MVLAAPARAQLATLRDRFNRCLHRLRAALHPLPTHAAYALSVMPGAGVPETLVAVQLDSEARRLAAAAERQSHRFLADAAEGSSSSSSSAGRSPGGYAAEQAHSQAVCRLLAGAREAFRRYVRTVSENQGASWAEAAQAVSAAEAHAGELMAGALEEEAEEEDGVCGVCRLVTSGAAPFFPSPVCVPDTSKPAAARLHVQQRTPSDDSLDAYRLDPPTGSPDRGRGHPLLLPPSSPVRLVQQPASRRVLDVVDVKGRALRSAVAAAKMILGGWVAGGAGGKKSNATSTTSSF